MCIHLNLVERNTTPSQDIRVSSRGNHCLSKREHTSSSSGAYAALCSNVCNTKSIPRSSSQAFHCNREFKFLLKFCFSAKIKKKKNGGKNNKPPLSFSLPWNRFRALFWGPSMLPPITLLIFFLLLSANEGSTQDAVARGERASWVLYRKPCVLQCHPHGQTKKLWEDGRTVHCTAVFTLPTGVHSAPISHCSRVSVLFRLSPTPQGCSEVWAAMPRLSLSQTAMNDFNRCGHFLTGWKKGKRALFILRTRSSGVMAAPHTHTGTHYAFLASLLPFLKMDYCTHPQTPKYLPRYFSSRTKCQQ